MENIAEGFTVPIEDVVSFFRRVTKLEPTEDQKRLLLMLIDPKVKGILISAGRQTGKTLTCAVATIWLSISHKRINIILTSAQDNWLYAHIKDIWNRNLDLRQYVAAEGVFGIVPLKGYETKEGSKVHVRPSTEKGLRGVPGDIGFADEAAEMNEQTIMTLIGNLSGEFNKLIMLSTPHKTGKFTELISDPEKFGFVLFHWSEEGCAWHSKEELKRKKQMMSPQQYKMEVQGLPLDRSERAFFPMKHLEHCIMEVEPIKEGGEKSTTEAGIDFGFDSPTVFTLTEKIGSTKRKLLYRKIWKGKTIEEQGPEILELIRQLRPSSVKGDSKPPQYKRWFEQYAMGKIHFIDLALGHKDQMMGQLQRKVREHNLILSTTFPDVIIQMKKYRLGMREGDDLVDSLALSCYEPPGGFKGESGGRWYVPPPKKKRLF